MTAGADLDLANALQDFPGQHRVSGNQDANEDALDDRRRSDLPSASAS